jgi:NCAIR mutase (PurE)-related protein
MTEPGSAGSVVDTFAQLDHERTKRRGYPEAVYCTGKTPEQLGMIAAAVRDQPYVTLFTRANKEHAAAILAELPGAFHDQDAHLLAWPARIPDATGGLVVVLAAGTSDLPVAKEAQLTASYLGRPTELIVDVGVAGPAPCPEPLGRAATGPRGHCRRGHGWRPAERGRGTHRRACRGIAHVSRVRRCFRWTGCFARHAQRVRAWCGVVNIDNGYGAGHLAAQIAAP